MTTPNKVDDVHEHELEDPDLTLERAYLEGFLQARGFTLRTLKQLPKARRQALMSMASSYASGKLANAEAREKLLHDLRHSSGNQ